MNPRAVAVGALAAGLAGGAGITSALSSGARESITLALTDTVTPRFSVKTDTVLGVVGNSIVPRHCGTGSIYLRVWHGTTQLSADTVTAVVSCALPPDTLAATVIVCTQNDSEWKANPLPDRKELDSAQYELAKQVAHCGPDSTKAP